MNYNWDVLDKNSYNNRMGLYKTKAEYNFIKTHLKPNSKILDIGGGSGRFAIPIHKLGYDITVLEPHPKALEILCKRDPSITKIQCNFRDFNFGCKYDLIMAIEVIELIQDWDAFFSRINECLKNDGQFIFTVTNSLSWRFFLRKLYHRVDYGYTTHSISDIKNIVQKHHLIVENIEGFYWMPFKLNSNNILISFFVFFEKALNLKKFISQSPWLFITLKKLV